MTIIDELRAQRDALRGTTSDIRTLAGILLIAPGSALAGSGIITSLDGTPRLLAVWAAITAVAIVAPIGLAIRPRRPRLRRATREAIIARAGVLAGDGPAATALLAEEVEHLQGIVADKWGWIWVALILGGLALFLAAAAVIADSY